ERDDAVWKPRGRRYPFDDPVDRALRDSDDRVSGVHCFRLEPRAQTVRGAALPVGSASRTAADGPPPLAYPRILVVEDARNVERPLQAFAKQRGVHGIHRDEERVETLAGHERMTGPPQTGHGTQAEVAQTDTPRHIRPPGRCADDAQRLGEERFETG